MRIIIYKFKINYASLDKWLTISEEFSVINRFKIFFYYDEILVTFTLNDEFIDNRKKNTKLIQNSKHPKKSYKIKSKVSNLVKKILCKSSSIRQYKY
jgi:hypothetical protein